MASYNMALLAVSQPFQIKILSEYYPTYTSYLDTTNKLLWNSMASFSWISLKLDWAELGTAQPQLVCFYPEELNLSERFHYLADFLCERKTPERVFCLWQIIIHPGFVSSNMREHTISNLGENENMQKYNHYHLKLQKIRWKWNEFGEIATFLHLLSWECGKVKPG